MDAGEAMDQHRIIGRVAHHLPKLLHVLVHGRQPFGPLRRLEMARRNADVVDLLADAKVFLGLVGGGFVQDRSVAQRDDGADAVVVDNVFQTEQGKLAAAVEHAFLDDVEIARLGLQVQGQTDRGADAKQYDDDADDGSQQTRHDGASLPGAMTSRVQADGRRILPAKGVKGNTIRNAIMWFLPRLRPGRQGVRRQGITPAQRRAENFPQGEHGPHGLRVAQ